MLEATSMTLTSRKEDWTNVKQKKKTSRNNTQKLWQTNQTLKKPNLCFVEDVSDVGRK